MVTDPTMEDQVRITIIATGFPSSESYNELRDQELATLVSGSVFGNQEPDIDLPPFLRNSSMARRRLTCRLNGFEPHLTPVLRRTGLLGRLGTPPKVAQNISFQFFSMRIAFLHL